MANRLNPYLSFDGNARQAMEHYQRTFGGQLDLMTFGDMGGAEPGSEDKIMHGALEAPGGLYLMGADTPPGMEHRPGNTMAVSLSGDDATELRRWWEALSGNGGSVTVPLETQMWGDEFGMCVDRFGVMWMVNIAGPQNAA
ncbi:VOC family protein [Streptomyces sp. ODS05-4]|uniref:VOC family protein n=1 Tax=Streptomyces sp. ODS05-4 TaxID=2944939 RepID=UPI00210AAD02|nr:VOC family protein [Streptomyces sp. ODS05-4]